MKNTPNISLNHIITPYKPPACSNTTYHHKSNFQQHKYRVLYGFQLKFTYFAQTKITTLKKKSKVIANNVYLTCKRKVKFVSTSILKMTPT